MFIEYLNTGHLDAYIFLGDVEIMIGNTMLAETYYKKAFAAGVSKGARKIGKMYRNGTGRPVDNVKALYWFFLAREEGVPNMDAIILSTKKKLGPDDLAKVLKMSSSLKQSEK